MIPFVPTTVASNLVRSSKCFSSFKFVPPNPRTPVFRTTLHSSARGDLSSQCGSMVLFWRSYASKTDPFRNAVEMQLDHQLKFNDLEATGMPGFLDENVISPNKDVQYLNDLYKAVDRNKIKKAEELFRQYDIEDLSLPKGYSLVVPYNVMLRLYSRNKEVDKFEELLKEMSRKGIEPNMFTYNARLKLYSSTLEYEKMQDLFDKMLQCFDCVDAVSYNILIAAYSNLGAEKVPVPKFENLSGFEAAHQILDLASKNRRISASTYKTMITQYVYNGLLEDAKKIWNAALKNPHIQMNSYLYTAAIQLYTELGDWESCMKIWNRYKYLLEWHPPGDERHLYKKYIQRIEYGPETECEKPVGHYVAVKKQIMRPTSYTEIILLRCCFKFKEFGQMLKIFGAFRSGSVYPHVTSCSMAMHAYYEIGDIESGIKMFKRLYRMKASFSSQLSQISIKTILVSDKIEENIHFLIDLWKFLLIRCKSWDYYQITKEQVEDLWCQTIETALKHDLASFSMQIFHVLFIFSEIAPSDPDNLIELQEKIYKKKDFLLREKEAIFLDISKISDPEKDLLFVPSLKSLILILRAGPKLSPAPHFRQIIATKINLLRLKLGHDASIDFMSAYLACLDQNKSNPLSNPVIEKIKSVVEKNQDSKTKLADAIISSHYT
ncbi:uncharacterized protein LOC126318211 [Schistocerca gregaria]|uniref:uncharacterized protein LOC126318211 n=1 Tax=Schistocerca gregaria TaxID=7010 RepID=UPI00211E6219|nr:uncharacterized protein LOC126318211 [Schistocerca gregaria]